MAIWMTDRLASCVFLQPNLTIWWKSRTRSWHLILYIGTIVLQWCHFNSLLLPAHTHRVPAVHNNTYRSVTIRHLMMQIITHYYSCNSF